MARDTLASPLIGITNSARFIYLCLDTSKRHLQDSTILHPTNLNTNHTHTRSLPTAQPSSTPPAASKDDKKYIRQVVGVLLYYARAVDPTLLVALSTLASAQATSTAYTMSLVKWLHDYVATQPDTILTYKKATWY
jgi:hypothetical protein